MDPTSTLISLDLSNPAVSALVETYPFLAKFPFTVQLLIDHPEGAKVFYRLALPELFCLSAECSQLRQIRIWNHPSSWYLTVAPISAIA